MNLGLIGYPLTHSFSKQYFKNKFDEEGLTTYRYDNYPLENLEQFPELLSNHPDLRGLNVTIPHKQKVVKYIHELDAEAAAIGAVNTIVIA